MLVNESPLSSPPSTTQGKPPLATASEWFERDNVIGIKRYLLKRRTNRQKSRSPN